jgi:hypothetical protein
VRPQQQRARAQFRTHIALTLAQQRARARARTRTRTHTRRLPLPRTHARPTDARPRRPRAPSLLAPPLSSCATAAALSVASGVQFTPDELSQACGSFTNKDKAAEAAAAAADAAAAAAGGAGGGGSKTGVKNVSRALLQELLQRKKLQLDDFKRRVFKDRLTPERLQAVKAGLSELAEIEKKAAADAGAAGKRKGRPPGGGGAGESGAGGEEGGAPGGEEGDGGAGAGGEGGADAGAGADAAAGADAGAGGDAAGGAPRGKRSKRAPRGGAADASNVDDSAAAAAAGATEAAEAEADAMINAGDPFVALVSSSPVAGTSPPLPDALLPAGGWEVHRPKPQRAPAPLGCGGGSVGLAGAAAVSPGEAR